jgi:hypothetical protein
VNPESPVSTHRDLIEHLIRQTALSPAAAERIVNEVIAHFSESPDEFVRRRHLELRQQGHSNSSIYRLIQQELGARLFAAAPHSERKIRRIIYG